jgi:hypothetical protein
VSVKQIRNKLYANKDLALEVSQIRQARMFLFLPERNGGGREKGRRRLGGAERGWRGGWIWGRGKGERRVFGAAGGVQR